ncbi:MAG: carbon storage regulator [Pyrinomonadaceae bacterium]
MLVLSRRTGQKIVIGNEIEIEIISIGGEGVRVGISAPHETSVHRYEVFTDIKAANRAAEIISGTVEARSLENLVARIRPINR